MKAPRVGRKRGSQRLTPVPAPLRPKKPVRGKGPAKPPTRGGGKPAPFPGSPPRGGGKTRPGRPAKPPTRGRRKPAPFPGNSSDMKPGTGRGRRKPTPMPTKPTRPGKPGGGKFKPVRGKLR